mmetsp:Transcript_12972/g.19543  ORF Transcript_12972/g.19543 Transcript_12972/m.19543 type:complete len:151 (+) Transcript_12972:115-567(+)
MVLTREEIDSCRKAFLSYDKDRSGSIDIDELRAILQVMRLEPTEEELRAMLMDVDDTNSGAIDFTAFLKLIETLKQKLSHIDNHRDMTNAWQACGGLAAKGGRVSRDSLVQIIQEDFGLLIDVDELLKEIDIDDNGDVEFEEFKKFFQFE